jgi:hypothetical protein
MPNMQAKIKEELLKNMYGDVDKIYDAIEQRFILSKEHEDLAISQLNRLKDQLYLIITQSKLS